MRREELFLRDIVEAVDFLSQFIAGMSQEDFNRSELVRSAVVHKLTLIGEAAAHLSDEFRAQYPNIPWRQIVAFRNVMIHAYFGIDWDEVWKAAKEEAPHLRYQIAAVLNSEFPSEPLTGDPSRG